MPIDKKEKLEGLYAKFKNCLLCPLAYEGRTQVVFGSGNPNSPIMLIGEAPGQQEDFLGLPFVGKSGQLLTKILSIARIKREEIYISNIVKCRPKNNRKPIQTETKICSQQLLFEEIKIINPRIIYAIGATALEGLLNQKLPITKHRGSMIPWNQSLIIPTFHPAYILRNPKDIHACIDDFLMAEKILNSHK